MSKKILLIIILGCLLAFHINAQPGTKISVKVSVHGKDDQLTTRLLSDLRNDLRTKTGVQIAGDADDSSTFTLSVQYVTLKDGDNLLGFCMSALLTKRIRNIKNEKADMVLKCSIASTRNPSEIDDLCRNLVDDYDVKFFDPERQRP